ncbi:LruC domain-containing protein [Telluribacter sp. SYSU D00476]|uniref:LruC domain-containing protein n=1 Tax=Telluribacter sp. SYSU D00476 TaxID=2811430 RepID=UPI001FF34A83|nr:LruC domain-containing protein [Telluribacter sp. SYSU D00476]
MKVNESFDFRSTRDVQLNVRVGTSSYADERARINVYNDLPTIGQLVATGIASLGKSFKLEFRIPASLTDLYVEKIDANGASEVKKIHAGTSISADFLTAAQVVSARQQAGSGLDCTTGVTKAYSNHKGDLTIKAGDVIALTGTYSGKITMNGGTLRICGTATIPNLITNKSAACKIYFLEGSTVTISATDILAPTTSIYNYSNALSFTQNLATGGSYENYGKMTVNGNFTINNNTSNTYLNNGELIVKQALINNRHLVNNNYIMVEGYYEAGGESFNENNCRLIIDGNFIPSYTFTNNSYIKVGSETRISGKSNLVLNSGAMLSTSKLVYEGTITGKGTTKSVVKVAGTTSIGGAASMEGSANLCDANGIEQNSSRIASSYFSCGGTYLPTSSCNPEGFGTLQAAPTIIDTDKDGVADSQDDYPNDPTRAYNTYYPSATGWATYGFEDLWPAQGDYDFNDLVINSRITRVFNADNKLVEMKNQIIIRAIGASYDNGFGFQLDGVSSSEVASVTGYSHTKGYVQLAPNKTEAGQSKAVIVAYDTPEPLIKRVGGSMFNTVKESPAGTPGQLELVVRFATPLDPAKASQEKINPFIIVDGKREVEVHLANYAPTGKANASLLGTLEDTSKPGSGRYYRSASNLPWAIELPVEFNYPAEKVPVTEAYLFFADWAQSGGQLRTDWYLNKAGYTNNQKTFK